MDRAYQGDETRQLALDLGFTPVVPPVATRVDPWEYDRELYKRRNERECPTGSRKSAATVNTSYPTFCISAMLSSSRSRCAFSIQRCS